MILSSVAPFLYSAALNICSRTQNIRSRSLNVYSRSLNIKNYKGQDNHRLRFEIKNLSAATSGQSTDPDGDINGLIVSSNVEIFVKNAHF